MDKIVIDREGVKLETVVDIPLFGRETITKTLPDEINHTIIVKKIKIIRNHENIVSRIILDVDIYESNEKEEKKPDSINMYRLTETIYLGEDGNIYQYKSYRNKIWKFIDREKVFKIFKILDSVNGKIELAIPILHRQREFKNLSTESIRTYVTAVKHIYNNNKLRKILLEKQ